MKYLKWIFLTLLLFCLINIIYLYINYIKDVDNNLISNEYLDGDYDISDIYGISLYRIGVSHYINEELKGDNYQLDDNRYMIFYNEYVEFCNPNLNICDKYDYVYTGDKITINSEDYFVTNGTYDIIIKESALELSKKIDNEKMVYYFGIPLG